MKNENMRLMDLFFILVGTLLYGIAQISLLVVAPQAANFLFSNEPVLSIAFRSPFIWMPFLIGLVLILKGFQGLLEKK